MNNKKTQLVEKFNGKFFVGCLKCKNDLGFTAIVKQKDVVTINCSGCNNSYILFPLDESKTQLPKDPIHLDAGEIVLEEFRTIIQN